MARFVVLEHRFRGVHWDLMLEWHDVLRTWALEQPPEKGDSILASPLADHRLRYLDYEGPIGGDRGSVTRWDRGVYEMLEETDGRLRVRLAGDRLQGEATISEDLETGRWRFHWVEP